MNIDYPRVDSDPSGIRGWYVSITASCYLYADGEVYRSVSSPHGRKTTAWYSTEALARKALAGWAESRSQVFDR